MGCQAHAYKIIEKMETGEAPIDTELYDRLTQPTSNLVIWTQEELVELIKNVKDIGKDWKAVSEKLGELGWDKDPK